MIAGLKTKSERRHREAAWTNLIEIRSDTLELGI
jgi:hypothetical protein